VTVLAIASLVDFHLPVVFVVCVWCVCVVCVCVCVCVCV
jgi:hypothetical protein